ncbi:hypothetical protein ACXZ9G_27835 (plasmid) [Klebsiella pneumoniae]
MRLKSALYSRLLPHAPWGISFVRSASIRFGFMVSGHGMLIVEWKALKTPLNCSKEMGSW